MKQCFSMRFISILISSSCSIIVTAHRCEPFEGNQSYQLLFRWSPSPHFASEVTLDRDGILLATCYTDMKCDNYFDHVSETRVTAFHEGILLINYTIFSATRLNAGLWTLRQVQGARHHTSVVSSCNLKSYTKVDTIACENNLQRAGVDVVCEVQKAYPQAVCHFDIRHIKAELKVHSKLTYTHQATFDEKGNVFYKTVCKLQIPKHTLPNGAYIVEVSAYPNVTGDVRDAHYGTKASVQFDIDESASLVLTTCDEDSATDIEMICVKKLGELSASEEMPTNKTLEAVGVLPGATSKSSISGKCEVSTKDNDFDVICKFVHIHPNGVQCKLNLWHVHGGNLVIDGGIKTSELTSNKDSSYISECSFVVSGNFISPGQYQANVVASTEDGDSRSENLTIYFELEVRGPTVDRDLSTFSQVHPGVYYIICLLIVLLFFIGISAVLVKFKILPRCKKSVKVDDHRYEEIYITGRNSDDTENKRLYETKIECEDNEPEMAVLYVTAEERR